MHPECIKTGWGQIKEQGWIMNVHFEKIHTEMPQRQTNNCWMHWLIIWKGDEEWGGNICLKNKINF